MESLTGKERSIDDALRKKDSTTKSTADFQRGDESGVKNESASNTPFLWKSVFTFRRHVKHQIRIEIPVSRK